MSVRVRYAPSPTGSPHVGNIRTALFCYLFARHHGGQNLLRIEDTDRNRYVPGSEEDIVESLRWIGIEWDEGPDKGGPFAPYRQSERKEAGIYRPFVERLLKDGNAYKAFDTPDELSEMREYQQINKLPVGYFGGAWRDASAQRVEAAENQGKPYVVRLKMPKGHTIICQDAIRGRIEWKSDETDDQVLIKSDGMPTYHLAAMVDDHLMGITHIMRGDEWISSTPKHVWLFECLGITPPVFAHTTVIKGKDGSKLSKRHGDTRCLDYRAAGYLPEALANFTALIGWAPGGDREIMSMDQMIEAFDIAGLQPSPGIFDLEKLQWMNGHYIRAMSSVALADAAKAYANSDEAAEYWLKPDAATQGLSAQLARLKEAFGEDAEYATRAVVLEQERVQTLADFADRAAFFFEQEPPMDPKAVEKWLHEPHAGALLDHLISVMDGRSAIGVEECEKLVRDYAAAHGFEKLGPVVHPIRVALTGRTFGPGLFELMSVLGPQRMVKRFMRAKGLLP